MEGDRKFPAQQIPYKSKGTKWRRQHLDWAEANLSSALNNSVAASKRNMDINYDLVNGRIHMDDIMLIMDPSGLDKALLPDTIQHYPVMNGKLEVLRGEEIARRFEYRAVCVNPNAVSEKERAKAQELYAVIESEIQRGAKDENELRERLRSVEMEFRYDWQDHREMRANALLNHYSRSLNTNGMFADGFMDVLTVAEEAYWCHLKAGEPIIEKLDPRKLHCWRTNQSSRIEDSDVIVYEDWWSPGRIYDTFYDKLTSEDRKKIEGLPDETNAPYDDETRKFVDATKYGADNGVVADKLFGGYTAGGVIDSDGNIRVIHMFWKSRRDIKIVKSYDRETGETEYNTYTSDYVPDKDAGEEVETYWVNEAWEGWKIGKDIYLDIRPCEVQFNTMANPSRCHFGIIGNYYNINGDRVTSMVDILKPFQYLYDVVHERLNEDMASSLGAIYELDLASKPDNMTIDQFLFYMRKNHIAVKDSFREGDYGAALGKIAGNYAANSRGIIGNNNANTVQQHEQILEFIKNEMSQACGITPQREGMVQNRETVGGIERATLQSSYITEWLYSIHADVKRRVLECFLEVAKFGLKGRNETFQYQLSDGSLAVVDIDGDEFSENDYGIFVDNSPYSQNLSAQLNQLAQAAMQNSLIGLSSIMKLMTSTSVAESIRRIEIEEENNRRTQQEQFQAQQEQLRAELESRIETERLRMEIEERKSVRDSETRIEVARIQAEGRVAAEKEYGEALIDEQTEAAKIREDARQFDAQLRADSRQNALQNSLEAKKNAKDAELKERELDIKEKELEIKRIQARHTGNTSRK